MSDAIGNRCSSSAMLRTSLDEEPAVGDLEALAVCAVRRGGQRDDLNGPAVRGTVPITHTGIMPQVRWSLASYGEGPDDCGAACFPESACSSHHESRGRPSPPAVPLL
jgi:hypothetical protein